MISVCLATCQGSAFLAEQLRSVLEQLGPQDEVVISDDSSTDSTLDVIASMADARVRLIRGAGDRIGVVRNFEKALRAARGDCIFLCDQDDIWLPGKVEHCVRALDEHQLVVTDCAVVDARLNPLAPSFFLLRKSGPGVLRNLWQNSYLGCCMAMRRSALDLALPFPRDIAMHDWWIGLIAQATGGVCFLSQPLLLYRRHGGNASQTTSRSTAGLTSQIYWRLYIAFHLLVRTMFPRSSRSRAPS